MNFNLQINCVFIIIDIVVNIDNDDDDEIDMIFTCSFLCLNEKFEIVANIGI